MSDLPLTIFVKPHDYDDDGVCRVCGHDGAEWYWWKHSTYEGRASNLREPQCVPDKTRQQQ